MRRTWTGWFFTITSFLACPCHLVITLPLALTLLRYPRWLPQAGAFVAALVLIIGLIALVHAAAGSSAPNGSRGTATAPSFHMTTIEGTTFEMATQRGHSLQLARVFASDPRRLDEQESPS